MSFNGSGTFNINTSGQPVVTGTVISSTVFNALTADLATGLSTCITKDGQTTVSANIPMNSFKFTGLAAGTAATDSARLGQVQAGTATVVTVTGTDTYVGTMSPPLTAYAAGNIFTFVVPNTNTTGCTLNIDSVGAKALTRDGSTALVAGDLVANSEVVVVYDGTRFQVLNSNSKTNLNLSGTLTVAGNTTLSGGTANGVLYLNGSKVATSGSALTFDGTSLSVIGGGSIKGNKNSSGQFLAFVAQNSTQNYGTYIDQDNAGSNSWSLFDSTNSQTAIRYYPSTSGYWQFYTNGSERLRLDASGNLGLGVVPSAWNANSRAFQWGANGVSALETYNGLNSVISYNIYRNTSNQFVYATSNPATQFGQDYTGAFTWASAASGTAGTVASLSTKMTLDASGNLGLGTSSPSSSAGYIQQTINGTSGSAVNFQVNGTDTIQVLAQANQARFIAKGASTVLTLETNGAERARIDTSGNFLLGTTNAGSNTNVLLVGNAGTGATSQQGCALTPSGVLFSGHANGTASGTNYAQFNYAAGLIGSISQNGTTAVAYNTTSDYRLKDDQKPLTGSGAFIDSLKPKTWTWKSDGTPGVGFIAHEVQEVSPNTVVGEKDAVDEDGKPIYQAMEYGSAEFIANIVAELQSLRARVAQLEGAK